MSFSDEDIKRLKDWVGYAETKYNGKGMESIIREIDAVDMKALLARLEAAETAIKYLRFVQEDDGDSIEYSSGVRDEADQAYEAWRLSAGKDK